MRKLAWYRSSKYSKHLWFAADSEMGMYPPYFLYVATKEHVPAYSPRELLIFALTDPHYYSKMAS